MASAAAEHHIRWSPEAYAAVATYTSGRSRRQARLFSIAHVTSPAATAADPRKGPTSSCRGTRALRDTRAPFHHASPRHRPVDEPRSSGTPWRSTAPQNIHSVPLERHGGWVAVDGGGWVAVGGWRRGRCRGWHAGGVYQRAADRY